MHKNPDVRDKKYKLKPGQYDQMYDDQNGECRICEKPVEKLVVDHDHKTGQVRGLLCANCNVILGLAYDDAFTLQQAAAYLLRFQEKRVS